MPEERARLAAIYARTEYRVRLPTGGWTVIVAGRPLPASLRILLPDADAPWGFITAWNPRSQHLSVTANRERQRQLVALIRTQSADAVLHPGIGMGTANEHGRRWREPSLLVAGVPLAFLHRLLRRFEQNAMLCGTGTSPAHLVWSAPA